jgi:hypothetical protein
MPRGGHKGVKALAALSPFFSALAIWFLFKALLLSKGFKQFILKTKGYDTF